MCDAKFGCLYTRRGGRGGCSARTVTGLGVGNHSGMRVELQRGHGAHVRDGALDGVVQRDRLLLPCEDRDDLCAEGVSAVGGRSVGEIQR